LLHVLVRPALPVRVLAQLLPARVELLARRLQAMEEPAVLAPGGARVLEHLAQLVDHAVHVAQRRALGAREIGRSLPKRPQPVALLLVLPVAVGALVALAGGEAVRGRLEPL